MAIPAAARAQIEPSVALDGVEGTAVLDALAKECYEAGLAPDMPSPSIMDCSGVIEERFLEGAPNDEGRLIVTHRLRFTSIERADTGRIGAEAWTETEELGSVIEQPVTSEELSAASPARSDDCRRAAPEQRGAAMARTL